jgi:hypothetical protein
MYELSAKPSPPRRKKSKMGLNDIVARDLDLRYGKIPTLALTPEILERLEYYIRGSMFPYDRELFERAIAAAQKDAAWEEV